MWIYASVTALLIYALYKECQALGCDNPLNGIDCDNKSGKAVKGTSSNHQEPTSEILRKIDRAASYNTRFVKWRSYLLMAFGTTMILWFILFKKIPTEWQLITCMLVIFAAITLLSGFYHFHLYKHVKGNIHRSVNILREREKHRYGIH